MSEPTVPRYHVCRGNIDARLKYPINSPPESISIDGRTWVLERLAKRRWNGDWHMWVCPHCDRADMSKNAFCPDCGVKFTGNEPSD